MKMGHRRCRWPFIYDGLRESGLMTHWTERTYTEIILVYVYVRARESTHPRRSMTSAIESTCISLWGIYM